MCMAWGFHFPIRNYDFKQRRLLNYNILTGESSTYYHVDVTRLIIPVTSEIDYVMCLEMTDDL